jgi:hypothetical protein
MPDETPLGTYTGIWQAHDPHEREFIEEIFAPYISSYVTDGKHELALEDSILFDAFCYAQDPAYYAKFRGRNAFLVQFLDENYEGGYELYENFRGVIRCFWSDVFNPQRVIFLPLGYSNGVECGREPMVAASKRRYVWSFLGQVNKSSRPDMAHGLAKVAPNFLFATDDVPGFIFYNKVGAERRRFPRKEYAEYLFESSFSPCPMGNANLECFRVYESLECGAIPIVEKRRSLDYFRELLGNHPMPTVHSWHEARGLIAELLKAPAQMDALQQSCLAWWRTYKKDYTAALGEFLTSRSQAGPVVPGTIMLPKYRTPGWQIRELLRHHDARAVRRRVDKQVRRLLSGKGTREAFRPGKPAS